MRVYPADVQGKFASRRAVVHAVLMAIFLIIPWIRIRSEQALLIDIWSGKIALFGLKLWRHDAPLLFFVVCGAATLLALVTALWGRIWCGWACPQTVFIEFVFRRIERWIEGNALKRAELDRSPINLDKLLKKILKWTLYIVISLVISHSVIAVFVGTTALAQMLRAAPAENWGTFTCMAFMTSAIAFNFGWFRERFCTLVCPYGRLQTVLMDESTVTVSYLAHRGEPRKVKGTLARPHGDCVDCLRCVNVCPTGIDIRNGSQLECIGCTRCIDACDAVMKKLKLQPGLISFSKMTLGKRKILRPALYSVVFCAVVGGFGFTLYGREVVEVSWVRKPGEPYSVIRRNEGAAEVTNLFSVQLLNQSFEQLTLTARAGADQQSLRLISAALPERLNPGEQKRVDIFLEFAKSQLKNGRGVAFVEFEAANSNGQRILEKKMEVPIVGPF